MLVSSREFIWFISFFLFSYCKYTHKLFNQLFLSQNGLDGVFARRFPTVITFKLYDVRSSSNDVQQKWQSNLFELKF